MKQGSSPLSPLSPLFPERRGKRQRSGERIGGWKKKKKKRKRESSF